MNLIAELKRRKVFKVGAAYVVIAWLAIQAGSIAFPAFDAPPWALRVFILLALLGFPLAVAMAWIFDATPEGIKLDARVTGSKRVFAGAAMLAVLALAWYFHGLPSLRKGETAVAAASVAARAPAAVPQKSIAVLAFTDLSPKHDQDYFADGIAEELLNALAQVRGLKVAGRTSSFYYKGRNEDLRSIGKALGVANVLEGSVRMQGDKVRITAQLIRSEDGFHLWSETYDGDLKDVFALQERIARSITEKLQVVLSGKQAEQLVNAGTRDPEAYALYLQATAIFNRREGARFDEAVGLLEQAIALDPEFARAYSRMATLQAVRANYGAGDFVASMRDTERFARRASAIDPQLAEPHAALALAFLSQRRYREYRQEMARALALDPNDVTSNFWNGVGLIILGYREQGKGALDRTLQLDPLLPNALMWRARIHIADGELDIAERQLQRAAEGGHGFVGIGMSWLYLARGDRAAAIAQQTRGIGSYFSLEFPPAAAAAFARASLGDTAAKAEALRLVDAYLATKPPTVAGVVPWVLIRSGEVARGFALSQDKPTNNDSLLLSEMFSGLQREPLRAPEFAGFARKTGLAAYWDEFGPPDDCRKDASGNYVCE